jgi:hypothetical protein
LSNSKIVDGRFISFNENNDENKENVPNKKKKNKNLAPRRKLFPSSTLKEIVPESPHIYISSPKSPDVSPLREFLSVIRKFCLFFLNHYKNFA